jgi:hypothetical protein
MGKMWITTPNVVVILGSESILQQGSHSFATK